MNNRYFIELSFKGTQYHGWQYQPNAIAVQQVLNEMLSVYLREKISTTGAGRTDTGVHASYFVAHFNSDHEELETDPQFLSKINQMLPRDIFIFSIKKMHPEAHARFDALSRTYKYFICLTKNPFQIEVAHFIHDLPDIEKMNEAATLIKETSDFTSFSKLHTDVRTNLCSVSHALWERKENNLIFTITADRFLRNMVRAIVGTLLDIGREKTTLKELKNIIESKNRCEAGNSVAPQGLFLVDIEYPEHYGLKKSPLYL